MTRRRKDEHRGNDARIGTDRSRRREPAWVGLMVQAAALALRKAPGLSALLMRALDYRGPLEVEDHPKRARSRCAGLNLKVQEERS